MMDINTIILQPFVFLLKDPFLYLGLTVYMFVFTMFFESKRIKRSNNIVIKIFRVIGLFLPFSPLFLTDFSLTKFAKIMFYFLFGIWLVYLVKDWNEFSSNYKQKQWGDNKFEYPSNIFKDEK